MNPENSRPWLASYPPSVPCDLPDWNRPLYALLDEAAKKFPRRTAIIFQNSRLSFARLHKKAERLAGALHRAGVEPGQRVAIMLPNLPQTMIAFWAVIKAGAVVVMINPLYMEKELLNNISDSGAEHIILQDILWERVAALQARLPLRNFIVTGIEDAFSFPFNWLRRFGKEKQTAPPVPYDGKRVFAWKNFCRGARRHSEPIADPLRQPAMLQYTGGTTGRPKGVVLTHANLGVNVCQVASFLNLRPEDRHIFLDILPFFHVYGLSFGILLPVAAIAAVLPMPRFVPHDVLQTIARHKPTIFPGAPAIYISLLQQKELSSYDLTSIRIFVSGSAPLPGEIFKAFQNITGAAILEAYGLTEASPVTHMNRLGREGEKHNSIGIPLPATEARIVDMEAGSLSLPPGKLGELVIKGPQVMEGYWNRPDETASALRNDWLYTGDLATMDENGFFYIVDRKKDMVIVGGYNVYPREVDEVLLEHPKIKEAVTVGLADTVRGEVLKAYVVPRDGERLSKSEIVSWCRGKLASYKVPRQVEFRDALPRTIVGKILRRALRDEEEAKRKARQTRGDDASA